MPDSGPQRCLVYCRVRPSKGEECNQESLLDLVNTVVNVKKNDKSYYFDGTLQADSTQSETFDMIAKPCVNHCLNGYCSALMAYGQTGTGKSHTMCCMKRGEEGIIPRAAQMMFEEIKSLTDKTWSVHMQFLQIYRDHLGDLMTETGKERVDIYFDKETGVTLPGCSVHEVKTREEFMHIYNVGNARRVVASTAMNPESSRSHTALVVWITSISNDMAQTETRGKITFIDLAGYERFSKTGISADNPIMRDEAKTINASLLSLGHVVSSLSNGDRHIPWRNSKLTRILQDSIGGRSRTTIILTVGPSPSHVFETTNTLQFGQRAMAVKVQSRITETVNYQQLSQKLQNILNEKEERINALELQAASHEVDKEQLQSHHQRDIEQLRSTHTTEIEQLRSEGASDEKIMDLLKQQEIEKENLVDQQREEILYTVEKHEEHNKDILEKLDDDHEKELADLRLQIRDLEEELNEKNIEILSMKNNEGTSVIPITVSSPVSTESPSSPVGPPNVSKLCLSKLNIQSAPTASSMADNSDLTYDDLNSIINDLESKSEKERQLSLNLQVELDRTKKLCQERSEDLMDMESYVSDLRTKYAAEKDPNASQGAGDNTGTFEELLEKNASKVSTVKMVDAKLLDQAVKKHREEMRDNEVELETLRKSMLALEMQQVTGGVGADENSTPMTARGFYPMTSRINMTARGMKTSRMAAENSPGSPRMTSRVPAQGPGSVSTHHLRLQLDLLRGQLEESHQEIAELRVTLEDQDESKNEVNESDVLSELAKVRKERDDLKAAQQLHLTEIAHLKHQEKSGEEIASSLEIVTDQLDNVHNENDDLRARAVTLEKKASEEELKINQQKELLKHFFRDDGSVTLVHCAENVKQNTRDLETQLNKKTTEVAKLQLSLEVLRKQLRDASITPEIDTWEGEEGILPNQVEVLLDIGDFSIINSCKEAELRHVYQRLFQREKTLFAVNGENKRLSQHLIQLSKRIAEEVSDFSIPVFEFKTFDQLCKGLFDDYPSECDSARGSIESHPRDASRSQLDSLLSLIKALRKQNAITQSLVNERSISLKHYAWLAMENNLVAPDFEMKSIVGDVASEIRLAFAERDEEIFTKDQAILQRCTEIATLEEGMVELHSQLVDCGHKPCRPATKLAVFAIETRQHNAKELEERKKALQRLHVRQASVESDLSDTKQQIEKKEKEQPKINVKPLSTPRESKIVLLRLRSKQEKLENTLALISTQQTAQEMEIDLLSRLKESSDVFLKNQKEMELDAELSVAENLRTKYTQ